MLKLRKIAITGGIASGKSTVCRFFQEHGAYIIDSDALTRELLSKNDIIKKIINIFGNEVLENNKINKKKLAEIAFDNPKKLQLLENLIHPYVFKEIDKQYQKAKKENKYRFFVVEIPLLFETHKETEFDYIITIEAEEKKAKDRMILSLEDYKKRQKRLFSINEKIKQSDFVIHNTKDLEYLKREVEKIILKIK